MGRYTLDILARYFQHGGKLPAPVVLPVVLHHSRAGWNVAHSFHDLFDAELLSIPGVAEHVAQFRVVLDDVSTLSDQALRSRAKDAASLIVPLTLWALRDSRDDAAIRAAFRNWAVVMALLWQIPDARTGLFFVLHYLTLLTETLSEQELLEALSDAPAEAKEAIMSLAEQWMARGRAEGEARGRAEGERRVLERQLRRKFGDAAVDESVLGRLSAAEEEQLVEWAERVLDAESLDAVFR